MAPAIDAARLLADLDALAAITAPTTPGVTRVAFTPEFDAGRRWLRGRFAEAGLRTFVDAGGNLRGRRAGAHGLPPIMLGSHSDTVFGGGRYDGALGVLAALEVARTLRDYPLRHDLLVYDFLAEEATDYGVACVGSQALAGALTAGALALRGPDGRTVAEALRDVGGDPERLADARLAPGSFAAALELHIEQGPRMERAGARLAAVSGIVGIRRARLLLSGQADHAGTTPMEGRHDALAAAAAIILRLEALARAAPDAIATVGRIEAQPNQGNVVPASVSLGAEIRSLQSTLIAQIWEALLEGAEAECAARGVGLAVQALEDAPPALPPPWLFELVAGVCRRLDPGSIALPSGAGHDTGYLAAIGPAAMIFVPSAGGRSHCPQEHTDAADLALGRRHCWRRRWQSIAGWGQGRAKPFPETLMDILFLNPFHGGSHAAVAEGYAHHSRHDVRLLALPIDGGWRWRMRGGAVSLARLFRENPSQPDLILTTDMLDLATFLALTRPHTSGVPTALYFHENQLTYPLPAGRARDLSLPWVNYTAALAADAVLFNSAFHRDAFVGALPGLLGRYHDYQELATIDAIAKKASVLPPGIDLARLDGPRETPDGGPPIILWNGRWEYDKNPQEFFAGLELLEERGVSFRLIVAGEHIDPNAPDFAAARERWRQRALHWGYAPTVAEYAALLRRADIVVSTAIQEFFGIAVLEALACGCVPVLPRRLAYPELLPERYHVACLYRRPADLADRLQSVIAGLDALRREPWAAIAAPYAWPAMAPRYDATLEAVVRG